ncbi:hypothetical protein Z042_01840 [Chania multitudinisentens RB-25]|uniref:HTH luxR-type domain-containing protein n=1 Tax=Chania multitudinisentens RB-25 TaxID=1441930 RepID=W0LJR9_9GAMM|nr:LuxR C-terminal-related transcriptional regulator [Chania multitudinisentens]AHG22582.1 hypothetical protein Z042_01840 [Chania multitudinisentens RB-25]
MEKKKLVLHCPCHFIQIGLKEIFSQPPFVERTVIVDSVSNLKQCECALLKHPKVEMVILALDNHWYNPISLLKLVTQRLPELHPQSKIALIGNITYMNMLKRYLGEGGGVYIFLDISVSLSILRQQLLAALQTRVFTANSVYKPMLVVPRLSAREMMVLNRVLNSDSITQIARDLRLHYKTVNNYKRSALSKLGVRSLPLLLIQNYNKKMLGHVLCHLSRQYNNTDIRAEAAPERDTFHCAKNAKTFIPIY